MGGKQQTFGWATGFEDLPLDPLCDHCGAPHDLEGPYCGEHCSQRARSNPDEHMLSEYAVPCDRDGDLDRDDCVRYWECSNGAADKDLDHVCVPGCHRYAHEDPEVTVMRSNAIMVMA